MAKKHLAFVDDDAAEVEAFRRLYDGPRFTISAVVACDAADALDRLNRDLVGAVPDLFVLDLYFPTSHTAPLGFDGLGQVELRALKARLDEVEAAVKETRSRLGQSPSDGRGLLRSAHNIHQRSMGLLEAWCDQLQQSPTGGIQLLEALREAYPNVPSIFYSRKATLKDAKPVLAAGALDLISKPDPVLEASQANEIADLFAAYADHRPPSFIMRWFARVGFSVGLSLSGPTVGVTYKSGKNT